MANEVAGLRTPDMDPDHKNIKAINYENKN